MTTISNIGQSSATNLQSASLQVQNIEVSNFDALLSMVQNDSTGTSSTTSSSSNTQNTNLLSNIFSALYGDNSGSSDATSATASTDPFSSEFDSTFGTSGPLFDYINNVTAGLGLTPGQNASLQNIAIENKDTTGSATDIQTMENELTAAGLPG
jgi:hypothetical protein